MHVNVPVITMAVDIPMCTSIEDIQAATSQDVDLQMLKVFIIRDWPHTNDKVQNSKHKYWPITYEIAMIDGIDMEGK